MAVLFWSLVVVAVIASLITLFRWLFGGMSLEKDSGFRDQWLERSKREKGDDE